MDVSRLHESGPTRLKRLKSAITAMNARGEITVAFPREAREAFLAFAMAFAKDDPQSPPTLWSSYLYEAGMTDPETRREFLDACFEDALRELRRLQEVAQRDWNTTTNVSSRQQGIRDKMDDIVRDP